MQLPVPLVFVVICSFILKSESARILGLFVSPSKSHHIIYSAFADVLAENGHNVTVVATLPSVNKNPNYRYIELKVKTPNVYAELSKKSISWFSLERLFFLYELSNRYANESLHMPQMRKLMDEESFDLVILGYLGNEFLMGVAAHFKCPLVLTFVVRPFPSVNNFVGNPLEVAYNPNLMAGGQKAKGFIDRLKNFYHSVLFENGLEHVYRNWQQKALYNQNFPSNKYPSYEEMQKNVSLIFVNYHFSQGVVLPNVPAMIEVGGIQIKDKADPLPLDIKSTLENSTEHGVIYFSLGTNIKPQQLGDAKTKIIFDVLSELSQNVLWKWGNSKLPGNSPNIIFKSWLPQNEILSHPNVRLFVTHGGQGSVVESEYHGVPMVAIPFFSDQHSNAESLESQGFGLSVDVSTITKESFSKIILEVLSNKKYMNNVKRFSKMFKDRPMTARQTALFWIEYVLRHHGALHMQSPAVHMNTFQLMSLDVIGFVMLVLYVIYKSIKIAFSLVRTFLRNKKNKVD